MIPQPEKIAALRVERRALDSGIAHPRNPRIHPPKGSPKWESMSASLAYDYFDPLILNERNGMWVAGHFRQCVMLDDGFTHADMVIVSYDEQTHLARMMAANTHAGDWEEEMRAILAGELSLSDLHAGLAGLTEKEMASLVEGPKINDDTATAEQLVSEADEVAKRWAVNPGDLFAVGAHRVLCGDCTSPENWHRLLGNQPADMLWLDPPYNVNYHAAAGAMLNDHMTPGAYQAFLEAAFSQAFRITKPGGSIYVAHADSGGRFVRNAFAAAGWYEAQCLIWVKNHFTLGRQDHQWQHEPVLYGWKPGAAHYWQGGFAQGTVIDDEPKLTGLDKSELIAVIQSLRNARDTTVIREPKPTANELHPTVKPLPLVARQIWNSSRRGETVAELFCGSGTTLIAAEQTERRCVATELDPKVCAVTLERATRAGLSVEKIDALAT